MQEVQDRNVRCEMEKTISATCAQYIPAIYKTFAGALGAFFERECPQIGGSLTREILVREIQGMVGKFYPEITHLKPGQIPWITVSANAKSSYGKSIRNTELVPVVLDLVQEHDAQDRANGKKLQEIKKEAVARLCNQAYEQGGCLTRTEIALLLKISPSAAGKYIAEYEKENEVILPRRGTIHDMGPTLTHKKIIIEKLFIEQKTVQEVIRETRHSSSAIERYITSFKQILLCYKKGMSLDEIAFTVKKSKKLLEEYMEIIDEYKSRNYILENIMKFEVNMETAGEQYEPYYWK